MPQYKDAASLAPFPADVPTAELPRLSLAKLLDDDSKESDALFDACRTTGFFALDLRDHESGAALLDAVDPVFGVAEQLLALDAAEKDRYAFAPGQPIFGYKGLGAAKVDARGTPDRCEFWSVSKDDVLGLVPPRPNPPAVDANRPALEAFVRRCHPLCELVSDRLDARLGLPDGTLASRQRLSDRAGNQIRMIRAPPQRAADRGAALVPHTDIGTVTVLFNAVGGLQILPPGADAANDAAWRFVRPLPGCALVNLGDAMVQWTAGALRSNMHRVVAPPGAQAACTRYSVAYFARPAADVLMAPLAAQSALIAALAGAGPKEEEEEEEVAAEEWERRKGISLRAGLNKPQSSGGKAVVGVA